MLVADRDVRVGQEADTPSERAALCGSVMGVCLWFENPIACLFEQLVMPDNYFSGETTT